MRSDSRQQWDYPKTFIDSYNYIESNFSKRHADIYWEIWNENRVVAKHVADCAKLLLTPDKSCLDDLYFIYKQEWKNVGRDGTISLILEFRSLLKKGMAYAKGTELAKQFVSLWKEDDGCRKKPWTVYNTLVYDGIRWYNQPEKFANQYYALFLERPANAIMYSTLQNIAKGSHLDPDTYTAIFLRLKNEASLSAAAYFYKLIKSKDLLITEPERRRQVAVAFAKSIPHDLDGAVQTIATNCSDVNPTTVNQYAPSFKGLEANDNALNYPIQTNGGEIWVRLSYILARHTFKYYNFKHQRTGTKRVSFFPPSYGVEEVRSVINNAIHIIQEQRIISPTKDIKEVVDVGNVTIEISVKDGTITHVQPLENGRSEVVLTGNELELCNIIYRITGAKTSDTHTGD